MLKKICIGVCFFMCLGIFAGCGNNSTELKWNAKLQSRIKQDYAKSSFRQDAETANTVTIHAYYGIYGESVALIINGNSGYPGVEISETVAEKTFVYGNPGLAIVIWNSGEFYTLTQAVTQELLTAANIEQIYTLYQE